MEKTLVRKTVNFLIVSLLLAFVGVAGAYETYFGPPSKSAVINLVDSVGPAAPAAMTVLYDKATNQMNINWTALTSADDRNYSGYPSHNLHATEKYLLQVRVDDEVDDNFLPVWTDIYVGNSNSFAHAVSYGHKYVYRVAGKDEAPYENLGDFLRSDFSPDNDIYSAPEVVTDLDAQPSATNSSIILTWERPLSQSTLTYNIYQKQQSSPLVTGDIVPVNLLTNVVGESWTTSGGRTYLRWEHVVPTGLITGGVSVDLAYAVCALDSENHEADISSGTGNRVLNSGFENSTATSAQYWLFDTTYIVISGTPVQPQGYGSTYAALINSTDAPDWQTVGLQVAPTGRPKAYANKDFTVKAMVKATGYPAVRFYSYNSSGSAVFLGYNYFDTIPLGSWQQISYTWTTLPDTETVEARFYANQICLFDDVEMLVPASAKPTIGLVSDTTPPEQITTLDVYGKYNIDDIYLEWNNPTDNVGVDHFRVYRNSSGQGAVTDANKVDAIIFEVPIAQLSPATADPGTLVQWINTDPWPGYVYYYAVVGVDVAGNEGLVSNSGVAMTGYPYDTVPPEAVTLIEVTFQKSDSPPDPPHKVYLEWLSVNDYDNRGDPGQIKEYNIYRQEDSPITTVSGLTPLATLAATVWLEDSTITPNTTYYYAVTARDISKYPNSGGNEGGFVNSLGVTADTAPPVFQASYTATDDYWCPLQSNGSTTTVKNNSLTNKYTDGDTIDIEIDLGETGQASYIFANFSNVDNYGFATNVVDNGNGTYQITHFIDPSNTVIDNSPTCGGNGYIITIQADDAYSNGPVYDSTFDVLLDNTAPFYP